MSFLPPVDRNPSPAKLRGFAGVIATATLVAALHAWLVRERPETGVAVAAVGLVLALATFVPTLGRVLYIAWMTLGRAIGSVTAPILVGLVYFVVVVPIGLLSRLVGRDPLRRAKAPPSESYWEPVPERRSRSDYFRPF